MKRDDLNSVATSPIPQMPVLSSSEIRALAEQGFQFQAPGLGDRSLRRRPRASVAAVSSRFAFACTTGFGALNPEDSRYRLRRLDMHYFGTSRYSAVWVQKHSTPA